jgi:beta-aspartyl-peptidase (threonine type)
MTLMWLMLLSAAFFSGWSVAIRRARQAEELARRDAEMARAAEMQARHMAAQALCSQAQARLQTVQQSPMPTLAEEIEAVLRLQAEAWNAGQIDRFMDHYWQSDELTFSAGGQITSGWQNTLDRYRQRYPTTEKMGRLAFDHLEVQPIGDTAALVLGQWHLSRDSDSLDGNFSLIMRKFDGRWLIVHDHTSQAEKPAVQP